MKPCYVVQVLTNGSFQSVRPSGQHDPNYTFSTEEEAERMARMCYPDQLREDRLEGTPGKRVRVVLEGTP